MDSPLQRTLMSFRCILSQMFSPPLLEERIADDRADGTADDEAYDHASHHFAWFALFLFLSCEWPHADSILSL